MNAAEKLTKARIQLLTRQPFFGALVMQLSLREERNMLIPWGHDDDGNMRLMHMDTACVDGVSVFYHPDFIDTLTMEECAGLLAHEVMHCALLHTTRLGNRRNDVFNLACDYVIDPLLKSAGFTLPGGGHDNPDWHNKSAEELYTILEKMMAKKQKPNGGGKGGGNGKQPGTLEGPPGDKPGAGSFIQAPGNSEAERVAHEQEWKLRAAGATQVARQAGKMPGDIDRLVSILRQPSVDWREELRRHVDATQPSDYAWTPPNKRTAWQGLYLPTVPRDGIGEIVVAVDTSGSVDDAQLQQFAGEINAIAEDLQPSMIHVVYADHAYQGHQTFLAGEPVILKAWGGGGTSFVPPFDWVEEQGIEPRCLVYLTDLYSSDFPTPPHYPTIWAVTTDEVPPWGEHVRVRFSAPS